MSAKSRMDATRVEPDEQVADGRVPGTIAGSAIACSADSWDAGLRARTADFEFVPGERLLVVPGLFDNRLTAYRLGDP